jgi:hypothetical protein
VSRPNAIGRQNGLVSLACSAADKERVFADFRSCSPAQHRQFLWNSSTLCGQSAECRMKIVTTGTAGRESIWPRLRVCLASRRISGQHKIGTIRLVVPGNSRKHRGKVMEARVGIEPTHKGFADLSLTTWVPRPECRCPARILSPAGQSQRRGSFGAGDRGRTGDIFLGKEALYH